MDNFWPAFFMTVIAALASSFGGYLGTLRKRSNKNLGILLCVSAGVILAITLIEILPKSYNIMKDNLFLFGIILSITFFIGIFMEKTNLKNSKYLVFFTLTLHNLPEGMMVFLSAYESLAIGFPVMVAIFIHNIPEGFTISAPLYQLTNNKFSSILKASLSGIIEPIGALIVYFSFNNTVHPLATGIVFTVVSGLMIMISIMQLFPQGLEYIPKRQAVSSFLAGMIFMTLIFVPFL